jgi:hypothetical protein
MNLRCDYTLISRTILCKNTVNHEQKLNNCSGNSLLLKLYWANKVWSEMLLSVRVLVPQTTLLGVKEIS